MGQRHAPASCLIHRQGARPQATSVSPLVFSVERRIESDRSPEWQGVEARGRTGEPATASSGGLGRVARAGCSARGPRASCAEPSPGDTARRRPRCARQRQRFRTRFHHSRQPPSAAAGGPAAPPPKAAPLGPLLRARQARRRARGPPGAQRRRQILRTRRCICGAARRCGTIGRRPGIRRALARGRRRGGARSIVV
jgi:hypothetical protein